MECLFLCASSMAKLIRVSRRCQVVGYWYGGFMTASCLENINSRLPDPTLSKESSQPQHITTRVLLAD